MRLACGLLVDLLLATLLVCSLAPGDSSGTLVDGSISDDQGVLVAGASVKMYPSDYTPEASRLLKVQALHDQKIYSAFTDENGAYSFDSVEQGTYTLVAEKDSTLFVKIDSIDIDPSREENKPLSPAILLPPATVEGTVIRNDTTSDMFIVVVGIDRYASVEKSGYFKIDRLPAGKYELQVLVKTPSGIVSVDTIMVKLNAEESTNVIVREHARSQLFLNINEDSSCTLNVESFGVQPVSGNKYVWYKDSTVFDTTESGLLIIEPVTPADTGIYSCNAVGDTTHYEFRLNVIPKVKVSVSVYRTTGDSSTEVLHIPVGTKLILSEIGDSLAKTGYTLNRWCNKPDCSGEQYTLLDTIVLDTADSAFYAIWDKNTCFVSAISFGLTIDSQEVKFGDAAIAPAAMTHQGHTFSGWYSDSVFTLPWDYANDTVTENMYVYAKWIRDSITVSFVMSPDSMLMMPLQYGDSIPLPQPPVRSGYTFAGWYHDSTCTLAIDSNSDTPTQNMSIYGKWIMDVYTVSIAVSPDSVLLLHVNHGSTVPLPAGPEREGFIFKGWFSDSLCTVEWNIDSMTITGNTHLYAKWDKQTYVLGINNSKVTSTDSIDIEDGLPQKIAADSIEHYHFVKWKVTTGSAEITDPDSAQTTVVLKSGNASVAAEFAPDTYQLVIEQSGLGTTKGKGGIAYGNKDSISAYPDTGYVFDHWVVISGNATIGDSLKAITTIALATNVQVKAVFELKKYVAHIYQSEEDWKAGLLENSSQLTVKHGVPVVLKGSSDAGTGYHFEKWVCAFGKALFENEQAITTEVRFLTDSTIIYPSVLINKYHLTIVKTENGKVVAPDSVEYGANVGINAIPDLGYQFVVWRDTGKIAVFADSSAAATKVRLKNSDATIYAIFEKKKYSVIYDGNSATAGIGPTTLLCPFESTITVENNGTLERFGYSFDGWNTKADGTGVQYPVDTSITIGASDVILYAQWNPN